MRIHFRIEKIIIMKMFQRKLFVEENVSTYVYWFRPNEQSKLREREKNSGQSLNSYYLRTNAIVACLWYRMIRKYKKSFVTFDRDRFMHRNGLLIYLQKKKKKNVNLRHVLKTQPADHSIKGKGLERYIGII